MASPLIEQAMSPEILDIAWRRLRTQHTPWSIDTDRDALEKHLVRHILQCRADVLEGRYRPQPLRRFTLRKPDGKQRILSAQYLRDKFVQRALLTVLEPRAEALFHEDSFAYRPNRNIQMALNRARERINTGLDWLVDADIASFFDSIPHRPLQKQLKRFIDDNAALKLIDQWLAHGAHQSSIFKSARGIAQGAILSPLFCNLYLHQFDLALTRKHIPFVRFADDFLLFAATKAQAAQALEYASQTLDKLGLELHPRKTRLIRSGPEVTFLGDKLPQPSR
ncbi:MAG TPA: Retron-type reverse transcriptase [Gammaproteobacteria bacterium]|nr:Retron-type reverse transcriptase [Gammaproteobacteria bacterium]